MDVEPLSVPQTLTATIADGAALTTTWTPVEIASVTAGSGASASGGNLVFTATGPATLAISLTVQMDTPGNAAIAMSWDGGQPVALGPAVDVPDDNPVTITAVRQVAQLGTTLTLYVLSTQSETDINWSAGSIAVRWTLAFPAPADAADFSATPPMPIDPGGNDSPWPPVPTFGTVIVGEPRSKTDGDYPYVLALPSFRGPPLIPTGTTMNISATPPFDGTQPPANNATPPMPLLIFNRFPAFPPYPS